MASSRIYGGESSGIGLKFNRMGGRAMWIKIGYTFLGFILGYFVCALMVINRVDDGD